MGAESPAIVTVLHGTAVELDDVVARLRRAGARFAFLHGSRATRTERPASDVDVAAWFGDEDVDATSLAADLPGAVDLLVLDTALELAGRVAQHGDLLFDDDPTARVAWQAATRKTYLDERPRTDRAREDFARAHRRG